MAENSTFFTLSFDDITNDESEAKTLRRWSQAPDGLIVISGGPGSGKTTTAYACLVEIARSSSGGITTVEDIVRTTVDGVNHITVDGNDDAHLDGFNRALQSGAQVVFVNSSPSLLKVAFESAVAGRLILAQVEADSATHAAELVADAAGTAINDHLVGVVWQTLSTDSETGQRSAHYNFVSGALDR